MTLISIVEESKLLLNLRGSELIFILAHHSEHSGWNTQSPNEEAWQGDVIGDKNMLFVLEAADLIVTIQALHSVIVAAIEDVNHTFSHGRVNQKEQED